MCTWAMQNAKSLITPDGNAQLWLQNFYDGCHNHYYQAQLHNRKTSGDITSTMHIRVWVCGTFKEDLVWNDTIPANGTVTHVSRVWSYGLFCGPQADNYDTHIWTPTAYHSPTTALSY
jgi:hypothetical protein